VIGLTHHYPSPREKAKHAGDVQERDDANGVKHTSRSTDLAVWGSGGMLAEAPHHRSNQIATPIDAERNLLVGEIISVPEKRWLSQMRFRESMLQDG
jgi:hypothetical protein